MGVVSRASSPGHPTNPHAADVSLVRLHKVKLVKAGSAKPEKYPILTHTQHLNAECNNLGSFSILWTLLAIVSLVCKGDTGSCVTDNTALTLVG